MSSPTHGGLSLETTTNRRSTMQIRTHMGVSLDGYVASTDGRPTVLSVPSFEPHIKWLTGRKNGSGKRISRPAGMDLRIL
jgi:hypothetical protein